MLYRVMSADELVVEPHTKRFHEDAFCEQMPRRMTTHLLPPMKLLDRVMREGKYCEELTIVSGRKPDWMLLRKWESLAAVHFPKHERYDDIDGVVVSKDHKEMIFYPSGRKDEEYAVPRGICTIGRHAFYNQRYLMGLAMSDDVRTICQGAFCHCHVLRRVTLSKRIKELPDATVFFPDGVFQKCVCLQEILLPEGLRRIGAGAFQETPSLKDIALPKDLLSIGEYAFSESGIEEFRLPKKIRAVGYGAFMCQSGAKRIVVEAYEGTAKGLISAIEAVPISGGRSVRNISWNEAEIHILNQHSGTKDVICVPASLVPKAAIYIDDAWNGNVFDYNLYDGCFDAIRDTEEKMNFAISALERKGDVRDVVFENYLKRAAVSIIRKMIRDHTEEAMISFIKRDYLSKKGLLLSLSLSREEGLQAVQPYILHKLGEKGKKHTAAIRI